MKKQGNILVVDDNANILTSLRLLLGSVFGKVDTLPSPKTMLALLRKSETDVVLLDMNFASGINSGNEGLFWLHEINRNFPKIPVVLFTAYADVELAVRAMKEGAFDFVVKPWDNRKLVETLQMAYRRRCELTGGGETPSPGRNARHVLGRKQCHAATAQDGGKSCRHRCQRADYRRERHRQGFIGTRTARTVDATGKEIRGRGYGCNNRNALRKRAVRTR
jgi:DNA-binding NtrC family response regulator